MSAEKKKILEMLQNGDITVEEATQLLNSLEGSKPLEIKKTKKKIRILIIENGRETVNITIPLKIAQVIAKFIPKSARNTMEDKGIDIMEIINTIDEEMGGEPLVNIDDGVDKVIITIE